MYHNIVSYLPYSLSLLDGLLKMLYMILLHQTLRHPGAPKTTPHAPPPTQSPGSLPEADIGSVTLALQTLGTFNFGGKMCKLAILIDCV